MTVAYLSVRTITGILRGNALTNNEQYSKIGKVMRHIHLLDEHKIPDEATYGFRKRAKALVDKWQTQLHASAASPTVEKSKEEGSPEKDDVKENGEAKEESAEKDGDAKMEEAAPAGDAPAEPAAAAEGDVSMAEA